MFKKFGAFVRAIMARSNRSRRQTSPGAVAANAPEPGDLRGKLTAHEQRQPASSPYARDYSDIRNPRSAHPIAAATAPLITWYVAIWPNYERASNKPGGVAEVRATPDQLRRHVAKKICEMRTGRRATSADIDDALKAWPARGPFGTTLVVQHDGVQVHVQIEAGKDYVTFSFNAMSVDGDEPGSADISLARQHFANVLEVCENNLRADTGKPAIVDLAAHQNHLGTADVEKLRVARTYLFSHFWHEFALKHFCTLEELAGSEGKVFVNSKGVVLPTKGLAQTGTPGVLPENIRSWAHVSTVALPTFSASQQVVADGAEANAVIKAFWPFFRLANPLADDEEVMACGIMNWRALFISNPLAARLPPEQARTALSTPATPTSAGERAAADRITDHFDDLWPTADPAIIDQEDEFILLTKHEPHPRQLGRIIERLNALATYRAFALKEWNQVLDVDDIIRDSGEDLNKITEMWEAKRRQIQAAFKSQTTDGAANDASIIAEFEQTWPLDEREREPLDEAQQVTRFGGIVSKINELILLLIFIPKQMRTVLAEDVKFRQNDARDTALNIVADGIETKLLSLTADLDRAGRGIYGGLTYRINRSVLYARKFGEILELSRITNIPTWVSYEQYATRSVRPSFETMESIGDRMRMLRARLANVTESIEASALNATSAATRRNTAALRTVATILGFAFFIYIAQSLGAWQRAKEGLPELVRRLFDCPVGAPCRPRELARLAIEQTEWLVTNYVMVVFVLFTIAVLVRALTVTLAGIKLPRRRRTGAASGPGETPHR